MDATAPNAASSQSTQRRRCTCKSRCSIALSRRERVGVRGRVRGCVTSSQGSIIARASKPHPLRVNFMLGDQRAKDLGIGDGTDDFPPRRAGLQPVHERSELRRVDLPLQERDPGGAEEGFVVETFAVVGEDHGEMCGPDLVTEQARHGRLRIEAEAAYETGELGWIGMARQW